MAAGRDEVVEYRRYGPASVLEMREVPRPRPGRGELLVRAAIRAICAGPDPLRHRSCAIASPLGAPNLYRHLDAPARLEGPLGLRRRGESLGLRVDDPAALLRAITERPRAPVDPRRGRPGIPPPAP